ncbi:hypothetical protein BDW69DRAFT_197518 [Aspergillus filifer]
MGLASRIYFQIATTVSSHPLANSLLILFCSIPLTLCEIYYKHIRAQNSGKEPRHYPLWLSLLLLASTAVDLPLISALHPITILYPMNPLDLPPSLEQLALQVLGLFLFEGLCHYLIQSLVLPVATKPHHTVMEHTADDEIMAAAILDFSTPRIALMLSVAALGIPCRLTECLGKLHPLSVSGWVILSQNLATLTRFRM